MQIKTITTAAGVNEIDFGNDSSQSTAHFYWLKNLGDSTLYVSANPDPMAEKDDVAELPAKGAVSVETDEGKIYVLGAGKVEIHRTNSKFCPFDWQSSGSGGGGGGSITIDSELSDTSTNPLQNKVTTAAIKEVNSTVETLEAALAQTQEDVLANTAALETKSDINHIHDISASGNPVIMDNLQGGVPFSKMVVKGKNLIGPAQAKGLTGDNTNGFFIYDSTASRVIVQKLQPNTTYHIKKYDSGNRFRIVMFNNEPTNAADTTAIQLIYKDDGSISDYTLTTGKDHLWMVLATNYATSGEAIEPIVQLELGETATNYEPPITGRELQMNVSGKNLLSYPYNETTKTVNGITFTDNGDGSITVQGTATARSVFWLKHSVDNFVLPKNTPIYISAAKEQIPNVSIGYGRVNGTANIIPVTGAVVTFDYENFDRIDCNITVDPSSTIDVTLYPQFELGSAATEYEPYHGSTTTITPTPNPYIIPDDISQQEGYNVISVSAGELSVVGVQKNAAIKRIWDDVKTLLGDISQFLVGRSKGLSDLIELWVGLGELSDPRCYRLIPVLSSNAGTNGVASCNTEVTFGTNETAYQAFDNNIATFLAYSGENVSGGWVMYEFISPVCVSKMSASVGIGLAGNSFDFHFEYYDDVSEMWVIFGDEMNVSGLAESAVKNFEMISDIVTTTKVRIISNTEKVEKTNWEVYEFQVYGYMSE